MYVMQTKISAHGETWLHRRKEIVSIIGGKIKQMGKLHKLELAYIHLVNRKFYEISNNKLQRTTRHHMH